MAAKLIFCFSMNTGKCLQTLSEHMRFVSCLQFDKTKVVTGSPDWSVKVWDRTNGECTDVLEEHMKGVWCLKFDEQKLISGGGDSTIKGIVHDIKKVNNSIFLYI